MATFNSFIQVPLVAKNAPNGFESRSPFYTKSTALYSESQRARYRFSDGKLTLQEIYGDHSYNTNIGRLNIGDSYIIPFPVKNINIENDYVYFDVAHRINILNGEISKVHNQNMQYGSYGQYPAELETKALEHVPECIKNFSFVHISMDAATDDISFAVVKLDTVGHMINCTYGPVHARGLKKKYILTNVYNEDGADGKDGEECADGKDGKDGKDDADGEDGTDGEDDEDCGKECNYECDKVCRHNNEFMAKLKGDCSGPYGNFVFITPNKAIYGEFHGYYETYIRFEYNCAIIMTVESDSMWQFVVTPTKTIVGSDECISNNGIYGQYEFYYVDADEVDFENVQNHSEGDVYFILDNVGKPPTFLEDDKEEYKKLYDQTFLIRTTDNRGIAKLNYINSPITCREEINDEITAAEIIKYTPSDGLPIKQCTLTHTTGIKDIEKYWYATRAKLTYCLEYNILYAYEFTQEEIIINVFQLFDERTRPPQLIQDANFTFYIRDWLHFMHTPTISIRGELLIIADVFIINIFTGEREYTANKMLYVNRDMKHEDNDDCVSSKYLINSKTMQIESVKTGSKYSFNHAEYSDERYTHVITAGDFLLCNALYRGPENANIKIHISTPYYVIFDIEE